MTKACKKYIVYQNLKKIANKLEETQWPDVTLTNVHIAMLKDHEHSKYYKYFQHLELELNVERHKTMDK